MNYLKIFLVCFLSIIFLNALETKAQCGWPFQPGFGYIDKGDCRYIFTYCVSCSGISPLPITVKDIKIRRQYGDCEDEPTREDIIAEILKTLNTPCVIPPCTTQTIPVSLYYPVCRKNVNIDVGGGNYYQTWETCPESDGACLVKFDMCYDPVTLKIIESNKTYECYGTVSCESSEPSMPPPGYTWFEEWEGDCWLYDNCNGDCP